jgi:hypothetical protein
LISPGLPFELKRAYEVSAEWRRTGLWIRQCSAVRGGRLGLDLVLEPWWNAKEPMALAAAAREPSTRTAIALTLRGQARGEGYRIGFGECTGQVLPAVSPPDWTREEAAVTNADLRRDPGLSEWAASWGMPTAARGRVSRHNYWWKAEARTGGMPQGSARRTSVGEGGWSSARARWFLRRNCGRRSGTCTPGTRPGRADHAEPVYRQEPTCMICAPLLVRRIYRIANKVVVQEGIMEPGRLRCDGLLRASPP